MAKQQTGETSEVRPVIDKWEKGRSDRGRDLTSVDDSVTIHETEED